MPSPFKIHRMLKQRHLQPFYDMLSLRSTTIDIALRWLHRRGYHVSRSAVANLKRRFLLRPNGPARVGAYLGSDREIRRDIGRMLGAISGRDLACIAIVTQTFFNLRGSSPQLCRRESMPRSERDKASRRRMKLSA